MEWLDDLDDGEALMCLDWHEYHDKEYIYFTKEEILNIFKNNIQFDMIVSVKEITEYRYEVTFVGDLLYFVCPINAPVRIKQDWIEIKNYVSQCCDVVK